MADNPGTPTTSDYVVTHLRRVLKEEARREVDRAHQVELLTMRQRYEALNRKYNAALRTEARTTQAANEAEAKASAAQKQIKKLKTQHTSVQGELARKGELVAELQTALRAQSKACEVLRDALRGVTSQVDSEAVRAAMEAE